jgi:hypothetical protein
MMDVVITSNKTMGYILGSILLADVPFSCLEVGALFIVAGSEGMGYDFDHGRHLYDHFGHRNDAICMAGFSRIKKNGLA